MPLSPPVPAASRTLALPPDMAATLWRGDDFGTPAGEVVPSGFGALDRELPGGGWPVGAVTELLQPQFSLAEAQLLLPALATRVGRERQLLVIGSPHEPCVAGWRAHGLCEAHMLLVRPRTPAEALWVTEQALRADGVGAVLSWLPHARPEQVRRLQASVVGSEALAFLMRPQEAALQSSAAPLRVQARLAGLGMIAVQLLKRRGPAHGSELVLAAVVPGLAPLLNLRRDLPPAAESFSRAVLDRPDPRSGAAPRSLPGLAGR